MGYKYVNHTADVEFVASGKNVEEAFSNAMLALFDTIADIRTARKSGRKKSSFRISEKSDNLNDLLWLALQDCLSVSDAKGVYAHSVKSISIKEKGDKRMLSATLSAVEEDPSLSKIYVKGISRFDLSVKATKGGYAARAVLDV